MDFYEVEPFYVDWHKKKNGDQMGNTLLHSRYRVGRRPIATQSNLFTFLHILITAYT